ncbi:hypothetical protein [uncultured Cohaesibacter sp.]|uniref:hypothetical protein n=1 Tax=uncultured Cohaesibacter sp. TaxID=1002546 RepID=UPI0029C5FF7F|nr:hypothetical protein [uncultured Cohaesibacter sp.]
MVDGKIDPEHERHRGDTILDFGFVLKRIEIRILNYKGMKFYNASCEVAVIDFFGPYRSFEGCHKPQGHFRIPAVRASRSIFMAPVTGLRTFETFAAAPKIHGDRLPSGKEGGMLPFPADVRYQATMAKAAIHGVSNWIAQHEIRSNPLIKRYNLFR